MHAHTHAHTHARTHLMPSACIILHSCTAALWYSDRRCVGVHREEVEHFSIYERAGHPTWDFPQQNGPQNGYIFIGSLCQLTSGLSGTKRALKNLSNTRTLVCLTLNLFTSVWQGIRVGQHKPPPPPSLPVSMKEGGRTFHQGNGVIRFLASGTTIQQSRIDPLPRNKHLCHQHDSMSCVNSSTALGVVHCHSQREQVTCTP